MIDTKFYRLLVVQQDGVHKNRDKYWLCKCDCGNIVRVLAQNLKIGNTKSCGCLKKEKSIKTYKLLNFIHGETNTKLWKTWKGIVERTTSKNSANYKKYGAKGIGIYENWLIYKNFADYIGNPPTENHSIDRIDNLKGYFPNNIRWATAKEQACNRKNNVYVYVDGQKMVLSDAAKKLGISKSTASRWFKNGKLVVNAIP